MRPLDQIIFATDSVVAAKFRCPLRDRERTGTTMHKYRLELRLHLALERSSESHADLSRVALDLGFSSHSHFSSMLRAYYGKTPTAVRQMVKLA